MWISAIYPSPMADFNYAVGDYCNVDPLFGEDAQVICSGRSFQSRPE
ncbi:alpha-amylase family glycosyl hydrolase [Acidisarcina polymorpha]|nr:alpha-amylase family glycosyl hydrolase [Acidisarcina polymorpha]